MKTGRVRLALIVATMAAVLLVPAVASANSWVLERSLIGGFFSFGTYTQPDVSGDNVVFLAKSTLVPTAHWDLYRYNLVTAAQSVIATDATFDIGSPMISGSWVTWGVGGDIHAKNISTGVKKSVTNDGLSTVEISPALNGTYVVWAAWNGTDWDVYGKNLATTAAKFLIAGGSGDQSEPSIFGKRVAYRDASIVAPGAGQIRVKTIGSTASAQLITNNLVDQHDPSVGDHMIAWRTLNGTGHMMVRYYNWDTNSFGVVASQTVDVYNAQVSGDRVLYDYSNGSDKDTWVFDARINRNATSLILPFAVASTTSDETWGKLRGNAFVYLSGVLPYYATLDVPSVSIGSVPKRIAHRGRLKLKGKLSDMGIGIGGADLRVEKYVSGRWNLVTTIHSSSSGTYSYTTAKNPSGKTRYRVAYDGSFALFGPSWLTHFSAVSSERVAWPR
jgi:hypothetical protein